MNQSISDLISKEKGEWVDGIIHTTDVSELRLKLKRTKSLNRRAIIEARIGNLNHLLS